MITAQFVETMALYNQWQNETLLGHCATLSADQLTADRGMFFGSILSTLNHILHVDQAIHVFIHTQTLPADFDPKVMLHPDYDAFKVARIAFDHRLVQEAQHCSQPWLDEVFEFWSDRLQKPRRIPRGFYYVQLFNHQTHHRSQITAELHKLGIDYGSTDLPANPYDPFS